MVGVGRSGPSGNEVFVSSLRFHAFVTKLFYYRQFISDGIDGRLRVQLRVYTNNDSTVLRLNFHSLPLSSVVVWNHHISSTDYQTGFLKVLPR